MSRIESWDTDLLTLFHMNETWCSWIWLSTYPPAVSQEMCFEEVALERGLNGWGGISRGWLLSQSSLLLLVSQILPTLPLIEDMWRQDQDWKVSQLPHLPDIWFVYIAAIAKLKNATAKFEIWKPSGVHPNLTCQLCSTHKTNCTNNNTQNTRWCCCDRCPNMVWHLVLSKLKKIKT